VGTRAGVQGSSAYCLGARRQTHQKASSSTSSVQDMHWHICARSGTDLRPRIVTMRHHSKLTACASHSSICFFIWFFIFLLRPSAAARLVRARARMVCIPDRAAHAYDSKHPRRSCFATCVGSEKCQSQARATNQINDSKEINEEGGGRASTLDRRTRSGGTTVYSRRVTIRAHSNDLLPCTDTARWH